MDESCQVTGHQRKHAIRLLNSPAVVTALRSSWEAAGYPPGYPWSLRLKALLPLWLPWARRRLRLPPAAEAQVLRISRRQIDRRLAPRRREIRTRLAR